jgi:hypothetical protein
VLTVSRIVTVDVHENIPWLGTPSGFYYPKIFHRHSVFLLQSEYNFLCTNSPKREQEFVLYTWRELARYIFCTVVMIRVNVFCLNE